MRFNRVSTACALAVTALLWAGCDAKKQTEYVAGISTQMQVPRDLKTIRVDVAIGGISVFCQAYKVYDGRVQLPRSLGSFPENGTVNGEPLTVTVVGFTDDIGADDRQGQYDCTETAQPGSTAKLLRRSRQPYIESEVLFLPMPLKFSCSDIPCESDAKDMTCKGGTCVDAATNPSGLPLFTPDLLDGTGGDCFDATSCFAAALPPETVTADDCTYAIPNTPSAPPLPPGVPQQFPTSPAGLNVQVVYDGGYTTEILDKDPDEGFTIPDTTKPQQFRLTTGLCNLVHGYDANNVPTIHRITAIRASGLCQPKGIYEPLCAGDALAAMGVDPNGISANPTPPACSPQQLAPAPSILMLLADDSENSETFYNGADKEALNIPLGDPAFASTEVGLTFFPGGSGTPLACTADHGQAVPPAIAKDARAAIASEFAKREDASSGGTIPREPLDTPTNLEGAMHDVYTYLVNLHDKNYYRRAVLVLGNRGFAPAAPACYDLPANAAAAAFTAAGVRTYVIMLANNKGTPEAQDPAITAASIVTAGHTPQVYDGRTDKSQGEAAFEQIVKDIATCVYEATTPPAAGDFLSYSDPVALTTQKISYAAGCNSDTATDSGWGIDSADPNRVRVCGQACDDYRSVLQKAAAYAAENAQVPTAVPVFAHKAGCL